MNMFLLIDDCLSLKHSTYFLVKLGFLINACIFAKLDCLILLHDSYSCLKLYRTFLNNVKATYSHKRLCERKLSLENANSS